MKKSFLILVCLLSVSLSQAQQKNSYFELWQQPDPVIDLNLDHLENQQVFIPSKPVNNPRVHPSHRFINLLSKSGILPGINNLSSSSHKKSLDNFQKTHKLDGTQERYFNTEVDAWVDYLISGHIYNDSGKLVGSYFVEEVDDQGTIDTIFRDYNTYNAEGQIEQKIIYEWDQDTWQLVPNKKNIYEFLHADTIIIDNYLYDSITDDWSLFNREVQYYLNYVYQGGETYSWEADSAHWELVSKTELIYTEDGKKQSETSWQIDTATRELVYSSKVEYDYDQFGNQILYSSSNWIPEEGNWKTLIMETDEYNNHNKIIQSVDYYWIADSLGLTQVNVETYEYMNDTLVTLKTKSKYNLEMQLVIPKTQTRYDYDISKRMALETEYLWNKTDQKWDPRIRYEYGYDSGILPVSRIGSVWNEIQQNWIISQKLEYEYDSMGRSTTVKYYNGNGVEWTEVNRVEYGYDSFGHMILLVVWQIDPYYYELIPFSRQKIVYLENGQQSLYLRSNWVKGAGAWISTTESYEYSSQGYIERMSYIRDENQADTWRGYINEFLYNEQGMFSEWMENNWSDSEQSFVNDYKGICYYGEQGKVIRGVGMRWDDELDKWIDEERMDALYDQNARIVSLTYSCFRHWDTLVDFIGSYPPVSALPSIQTGWSPIDRFLGFLSL